MPGLSITGLSTSPLLHPIPGITVNCRNTTSIKINQALFQVRALILDETNRQLMREVFTDMGVTEVLISHSSVEGQQKKDKKKSKKPIQPWSINNRRLKVILNAQSPEKAMDEFLRLYGLNVNSSSNDVAGADSVSDSKNETWHLEGQSLVEKLHSVPRAARKLYETFWEMFEPSLKSSGKAEDMIELCSGTGGQFAFYPESIDVKKRFVGIDAHPESNALLLTNHGVQAYCGDIFNTSTYNGFNRIYGRRLFAGCVGTNAIYFARDQADLRRLFSGLDSILSKGEPGTRFIAQLISGRPPSLNEWGGDPYKFKEQFFGACETELSSLGYFSFVKPIGVRLNFEMSDKDAGQNDYLEQGKSISGKTFNGILWDGIGCDFTPDGTLTNFLDYEYQAQQVVPLDRFHEGASAYLLTAIKVLG